MKTAEQADARDGLQPRVIRNVGASIEMDTDQLQARIRERFPGLSWSECRVLRCDHDVVILDDHLVFRVYW